MPVENEWEVGSAIGPRAKVTVENLEDRSNRRPNTAKQRSLMCFGLLQAAVGDQARNF